VDRRLAGVHLRADRGMDAVRADQERALDGGFDAFGRDEARGHTLRAVVIARDPLARPHRLRAETVQHRAVEQHVEPAPVDGILRPEVAGLRPAWLGMNLRPVQAKERPFPRRQPDGVERVGPDAEVEQFPHRVRLQVDPHPERAHRPDRFENRRPDADLVQRQRQREPADSAPGDQHMRFRHPALPLVAVPV
jgi:hypothetical protein